MQVVFLGAGASIPADYPPGRELIAGIARHFETEPIDEGARSYWSWFLNARASADPVLRLLWNSTNPEVVASYLDLCVAALKSDDDDIERYVSGIVKDHLKKKHPRWEVIDQAASSIQQKYDDPAREPLDVAIRARLGLLEGVSVLFRDLHWRDRDADSGRFSYLRDSLADLAEGDVVITTNYDALAERVLLAQGKWSPADGYGFKIPLIDTHPSDLALVDAVAASDHAVELPPAKVRVLKLHGSTGWLTLSRNPGPGRAGRGVPRNAPRLYLSRFLLEGFREFNDHPLYDSREPAIGLPGSPAIVLPTYLKQTEGNEFLTIWSQAAHVLARADHLTVLGFSLPEADIGVRVLLNPLRGRLAAGEVKVTVRDPSPSTHYRWRELLGSDVIVDPRPLGGS